MLLSELLQNQNINAQLFAFFNTRFLQNENFETKFCIRSQYRQSKYLAIDETQKIHYAVQTNRNLTIFSNLPFVHKNFGEHIVVIENDLKFSIDEYINALYRNILLLSQNYNEKDFEQMLLVAIFLLNGSADFNRQYYAVDIYREICTNNYFKKFFMLILHINSNYLNLNFRELQAQFISGERERNAQIRINLSYIYSTLQLFTNIWLNPYKQQILTNNTALISQLPQNKPNSLIERASFYANAILGKNLTEIDIQRLRQKLDFNETEILGLERESRNSEIIKIARNVLEDRCAACYDKYDIIDRTFIKRDSSLYLEIHHNITFSYGGNKCDTLENLVKLCPACHRALSKNRASENYQKYLISNILNYSQQARDFAVLVSQIDECDSNALVNFIYERLA